jgi:hypothetical protein
MGLVRMKTLQGARGRFTVCRACSVRGGVLRLKDVVTLYTGKKLHPKAASILRLELEMYIKNKYTCIKSKYSDSSFNGVRYKGWLNIDIDIT